MSVVPNQPRTEAARPIGESITDGLPCRGCGYPLRGLPSGGECPECGVGVAASREQWAGLARSLARSDLSDTAGLLVWVPVMAVGLAAVPLLIHALGLDRLLVVTIAVVTGICAPLWLMAAWGLTSAACELRGRTGETAARAAVGATIGVAALVAVAVGRSQLSLMLWLVLVQVVSLSVLAHLVAVHRALAPGRSGVTAPVAIVLNAIVLLVLAAWCGAMGLWTGGVNAGQMVLGTLRRASMAAAFVGVPMGVFATAAAAARVRLLIARTGRMLGVEPGSEGPATPDDPDHRDLGASDPRTESDQRPLAAANRPDGVVRVDSGQSASE